MSTIVFAWVVERSTLFDPEVHTAFVGVASETLRGDFATTLLRAIFAGWLTALMVWMLPAKEAQLAMIVAIPTTELQLVRPRLGPCGVSAMPCLAPTA